MSDYALYVTPHLLVTVGNIISSSPESKSELPQSDSGPPCFPFQLHIPRKRTTGGPTSTHSECGFGADDRH